MDWRWIWLWAIFYNALVHAVTLQWHLLGEDREAFYSWWRSLWSAIGSQLSGLRNELRGEISWLQGYAYGLFLQAWNKVWETWGKLGSGITGFPGTVESWVSGKISWVSGYAFGLYVQALNLIASAKAAVRSELRSYVDGLVAWVVNQFSWVLPFKHLLPVWVDIIQFVVNTLISIAWQQVRDFLADPIGYVLGPMFPRLTTFLNWWETWGPGLMSFVVGDLANLRNLLSKGYAFLMAFIDRPGETILELLTPIFLDWVERLIADNW